MLLLQILTAGIPFLIMTVCDWLKMDNLPPRTNVLIVILTTGILAAVWALFTGQFTQNMYLNFLAVVAISFGIMGLPEMAPIRAWLQRVFTSPFAMLPAARIVDATPTPATLRASLPRRDSSLSQRAVTVDEIAAQPTRPMDPMPSTMPDEMPAPETQREQGS